MVEGLCWIENRLEQRTFDGQSKLHELQLPRSRAIRNNCSNCTVCRGVDRGMSKNQCRNPRGLDLSLQQSASSWNRSAKTLEAQSFILPTDSPIPAHTTDLGASHCCGRTERLTYDVASPHVVARSRTKSSESLEGSTLLSSENTFPGSQPAPRGGESRRRPEQSCAVSSTAGGWRRGLNSPPPDLV